LISFLHYRCSLSKVLNPNFNLKFHLMDFLFEFLNIHMNVKKNCHDFHGFEWWNTNISLFLTIFLCCPMHFLACWVVTTPKWWSLMKGIQICFLYISIARHWLNLLRTCGVVIFIFTWNLSQGFLKAYWFFY
jgi:hypothetical protein